VALSWGLNLYITLSHQIVGNGWAGGSGNSVDSFDVQAIDECFVNAFGGI
jgi:hypothetical protein